MTLEEALKAQVDRGQSNTVLIALTTCRGG